LLFGGCSNRLKPSLKANERMPVSRPARGYSAAQQTAKKARRRFWMAPGRKNKLADIIFFFKIRDFYFTASKAASSAAIRSSAFSMPMDSLMVLGFMPWSSSSEAVSWEWVVLAGWMTSDFTSATFARREKMARLSINFFAVSSSPFISNVKMEPPPFGKYFL
jgi:hypothetical protein